MNALRQVLQAFIRADNETTRLKQLYDLYRQVHSFQGNASLAGLVRSPTCPPPLRRC